MEYDYQKLIFAYDSTGRREGFSFYNGNSLVGHYYYLYNAQGDVTGILNQNMTLVARYTYDSWGKLIACEENAAYKLGTLNPFRYRGYIYDEETKLYYLNSRYYDPETGRFLNADDVAYLGIGGILSYNLFAYCENDPINGYDPYGTFDLTDLIAKVKNMMKGMGGRLGGGASGSSGGGMVASGGGANRRSELEGVGNSVKVEGRGSTGRTTPNSLNEQMAMHQVKSNPLNGAKNLNELAKKPIIIGDSRWPATEGWVKMQVKILHSDETQTVIHFVYNIILGVFDDFKFK